MEKNLIDGEFLSKGIDIEDLFSRISFNRCLSFLENYRKDQAIQQRPDNFEEIMDYFTNRNNPSQRKLALPTADNNSLYAHGENKPPLRIKQADPTSLMFEGLGPLGV